MKDQNKTKAELIKEIEKLRKQQKSSADTDNYLQNFDNPDTKDQIFKMITENVSDLIAILDLKGKRLYSSRSYEQILGDPETLKGKDSFREIHPEDRNRIKNIFKQTVNTGVGQRAEYRFLLEDGSIRYLESQGNVIKNPKGKVENVIVVSRDITERENFQRALHDSEKRLKAILKAIPDVIYRLDPTGKITFMSKAIERYGYKSEDLLGREILDIVHPDDRKKAFYRVNERRTGNRRTRLLEIRLLTANGKQVYFEDRSESVPMDPVFLLEAEGLYSTDQPRENAFMGTQGIARDITERKKTEGEISMLAQAFKCISECVFVTDLEEKIIFVNDAFLQTYGYERHELLNQPVSIVRSKENQDEIQDDTHPSALNTGWQGEVINRRKDGSEFPVQISSSVINDPSGYPIALIGVATDITERKRLERQLHQSQKLEAIGKLAGGISHDFNNLLTVIQGYSELLLSKININDPIAGQIRQISEAANRAESLTRQLLAFSRKQIMKPRVLDLNRLITDMQDMLQRLIGADIKFVVSLYSDLGKIKADPSQVEQVIMNLVVNARDAMQSGGTLGIKTENKYIDKMFKQNYPEAIIGNYIQLTISDTGFGMDKETQAHIFEPFFTTKQKGEGTGLGLATVYGIIKQSGGYIYVHSELTKGTEFHLLFPRVDEPLDFEEDDQIPDTKLSGTETILVVEDQDEVRQLIVETLVSYGYHVLEAPHGGSALLTCERFSGRIDLIISDIVMPQMNGQELVERLLPLQPQMKILFISGYSENIFPEKSTLDPGTLFVQKPFTPLELLGKVRQVIDMD